MFLLFKPVGLWYLFMAALENECILNLCKIRLLGLKNFYFIVLNNIIYLFLTELGLCCFYLGFL